MAPTAPAPAATGGGSSPITITPVLKTDTADTKSYTKQPRVAAPLVFNRDAEKVDQFLADCWLNFQENSAYTTHISKITYALSYMKEGSAEVWLNNVVRAMCQMTGEGTHTIYEEFEKAVIENFKGGAEVEIVQSKMEALQQGS